MSNHQVQALVKQFEASNNELIALVESCSDANWKKACTQEEWSVAVTARHVADGHQNIANLVAAVATGQTLPPLTIEMIHQGNAQHAKEHANCSKAEVLELLRKNGAAAVTTISGLNDVQLANTSNAPVFGGTVSAKQVAENILLGHLGGHLVSLKATVGGK